MPASLASLSSLDCSCRAWGKRAAITLAVALAATACSPSSADDRTTSGPPTWSLAAEPRFRIGQQSGEAPYLFDRISGVRLLPDGGVVVADRGSSTLRVFDSDGTHLVSMGGPGEGPGEFGWLGHVELLPPDTILVYDSSLFRFTRYRTDGALIGTRPIHSEDGRPEVYLGAYSNGDVAIAWIAPAPRDPARVSPDLMRVGRFGADGSLVSVLGTMEGMRRLGLGPVPFSPFLHAWLLRDSVFYADGMEPTMHVLDEQGRSARSWSLPLPRHDADAAWASLRAELATRDLEERLDDFPPAARLEPVPAIAEVLLDGEGRFWLKHYEPATDSYLARGGASAHGGRWTVVAANGRVVAEIDLPDGFAPLDVAGGAVAGVHRNDLGIEQVLVFDLRR